jgi:hypothetical protein
MEYQMNKKVSQKIKVAFKLGRIKIKIDKSWGLPFSFYMYDLRKGAFSITYFYKLLEITLYKINLIFCILED